MHRGEGRMSVRAGAAAVLIVLVGLNFLFVPRAVRYAGLSPFARVSVDGSFFHRIGPRDEGIGFRSAVLAIGDAEIAPGALPAALVSREGERTLSMRLADARGDVYERMIVKWSVNEPLAWLYLVLFLVANVHWLWGFAVWVKNPDSTQARLYCAGSLCLGVVCFSIADLFSYGTAVPLLMAASVLLGYCVIEIAYALSGGRFGARLILSYFGACAVLLAAYLYEPAPLAGGTRGALLFAPPVVSVLLFIVKIGVYGARQRNAYTLRSAGVVVTAFTAGILAPFGALIAGFFWDLPVPAHVPVAASVLIPMLVGNGLMRPMLFSTGARFGGGFALFVINGAIALCAALSLLYIHNVFRSWSDAALLYPLFGVMMLVLLYFRRIVNRRLNDILFVTRDDYANCLQRIAEHVASPDESAVKLERAFAAVRETAGVAACSVAIFDAGTDHAFERSGGLLERMDADSPPGRYFAKHTGMAFRYSIAPGPGADGEALAFMRARNLALMMPVFDGGRLRVALLVGEKRGGRLFVYEDIRFFGTVAFQAYQMLENDRLFRDYLVRTAYEKELDVASYVQLRLFPKRTPQRRGLAITFYNRPFFKVTGDYFDFVTIDKSRTAIIIGDISGHGLSAAMVLSMMSSIIATLLAERKPIGDIMDEINGYLTRRYRGTDLITLFIGVYHKQTRELTYINAGHCPPAHIRRTGEVSLMEGRAKILGADPKARYAESALTLARGDELVLYTDGVIEIFDEAKNEALDEGDLLAIIRQNRLSDTERKVAAILERINRFPNECITDDITLIGVTVL